MGQRVRFRSHFKMAKNHTLVVTGPTTIATCVDQALAIPTSLERRFWRIPGAREPRHPLAHSERQVSDSPVELTPLADLRPSAFYER